jgi:hypothetical protein
VAVALLIAPDAPDRKRYDLERLHRLWNSSSR